MIERQIGISEFSEPEQPILSPEDQQVIEFGLHALQEWLQKKKNEELPTCVIFLETSARPFYAAVAPILKSLYSSRDLPSPSYHFLVTPPRDSDARAVEWREAQAQRLQEVIGSARPGNILMVDDFLFHGETISQINTLKPLVCPGVKLDFFVFFDTENRHKTMPGVVAGVCQDDLQSYDVIRKITWKKELSNFTGFRFTSKGVFPRHEGVAAIGQRGKEAVIGVREQENPSKKTERSPDANQGKIQQIRAEMSAIAEKVLSDTQWNKADAISKLEAEHIEF
ncbi:hypothetical protein HY624_01475 [Candidatus Uhrbacteria bacterium]|nr:hypothetical protein [Candidatus Uhrbacteria bacterium]